MVFHAVLDLSILDLSKTVMYEFGYSYVKAKYGENANFVIWIQTGFPVPVKMKDIDKDVAEDGETRFDTSNFKLDRPLPKGEHNKAIGLMKNQLGGQIMKEFVGLRGKTYAHLKNNNDEDKKAKGTKCVVKRKLKFED